MQKYAFFDFDNTICKGDSIYPFIKYAIKHGGFSVLNLIKPAMWGLLWLLNIVDIKTSKQNSLGFLRGKSKEFIDNLSNDFCNEVLIPNIFKKAKEQINSLKSEDYKVYIISASPKFYLMPLLNKLNIDGIFATEFLFENNNFVAKIMGENCKGAEKVNVITKNFDNIDFDKSYAFGDSKSDIPMMNLVKNKVFINAKKGLIKQHKDYVGLEWN